MVEKSKSKSLISRFFKLRAGGKIGSLEELKTRI
jgi:hypothetical protein